MPPIKFPITGIGNRGSGASLFVISFFGIQDSVFAIHYSKSLLVNRPSTLHYDG